MLTRVIAVALGVWRRSGAAGSTRSSGRCRSSASRSRASSSRSDWCWCSRSSWAGSTPTGYIRFTDDPSGWLGRSRCRYRAGHRSIASVAKQIRGSVNDVLRSDYVRTLRSRGLPFRRVVLQARAAQRRRAGARRAGRAVRRAAGRRRDRGAGVRHPRPRPDRGQATTQGDIPIVMGLVVAAALVVIVFNLLVDLAPRLAQPEGAAVMTVPSPSPGPTRRIAGDRPTAARLAVPRGCCAIRSGCAADLPARRGRSAAVFAPLLAPPTRTSPRSPTSSLRPAPAIRSGSTAPAATCCPGCCTPAGSAWPARCSRSSSPSLIGVTPG